MREVWGAISMSKFKVGDTVQVHYNNQVISTFNGDHLRVELVRGPCIDLKDQDYLLNDGNNYCGKYLFPGNGFRTFQRTIKPEYYGEKGDLYEAIKVIQAWKLNFSLGNVVKYVKRCGLKESADEIEDLQKAIDYLNLEIEERKRLTSLE